MKEVICIDDTGTNALVSVGVIVKRLHYGSSYFVAFSLNCKCGRTFYELHGMITPNCTTICSRCGEAHQGLDGFGAERFDDISYMQGQIHDALTIVKEKTFDPIIENI